MYSLEKQSSEQMNTAKVETAYSIITFSKQ